MRRVSVFLLGFACAQILSTPAAQAQGNSYKQTNLVSDTQGLAPVIDPNLVNPWGICIIPGEDIWIADNGSPTGVSSLYNAAGAEQGAFTIAPPAGSSNPATPTGCVGNSAGGFNINGSSSFFIFDTEDGTISGWTGGASSILAVDNSAKPTAALGAVYKGLALVTNSTGSFLLATNFRSGQVEIYDTTFKETQAFGAGAFNDPALPAVPAGSGSPGYAPFGVHVITVNNSSMVVVTYALQDTPMHDPLKMPATGFVDLFSTSGAMISRITSDSHLNAPWGVVVPPAGFGGSLAGDLLVGNFGDGAINAYNFSTGAFIDQMKDSTGTPIINGSLWDMVFGGGGAQSGDPNTMYITAGLSNEMHGLFAVVTANATPPAATADFSIAASPSTLTIAAGQPAVFTVTLGGLNGFSSAVALTCSGQPLGSTCNFSPASVSPASGGTATSMMTITTSSSPYNPAVRMAKNSTGGIFASLLPIPTLGLFGLLVAAKRNRQRLQGRKWFHYLTGSLALLIVAGFLLTAGGCGYSANSATNGTQRGMTTVMITGTSGSLTHSATVTLTVQ
ncbi:MAG TPA: TIGR03118 family protein [Candidatus Acidoferrum sp.]|nr:TIGR03118 family protein [Candidatus Acidoferrum sp.]